MAISAASGSVGGQARGEGAGAAADLEDAPRSRRAHDRGRDLDRVAAVGGGLPHRAAGLEVALGGVLRADGVAVVHDVVGHGWVMPSTSRASSSCCSVSSPRSTKPIAITVSRIVAPSASACLAILAAFS